MPVLSPSEPAVTPTPVPSVLPDNVIPVLAAVSRVMARVLPVEPASFAVTVITEPEIVAETFGLTAVDANSLDGSTTVAEQAVRQQIDQMLDDVAK